LDPLFTVCGVVFSRLVFCIDGGASKLGFHTTNNLIIIFHLHQEYRCGFLFIFPFGICIGRCGSALRSAAVSYSALERIDGHFSCMIRGKNCIHSSYGCCSKCVLEVHIVIVVYGGLLRSVLVNGNGICVLL
jgi:hypothetical protein